MFTANLNEQQLRTILAALHTYQNVQQHEPLAPEIVAIATGNGEHPLPEHDEVDKLIQYLSE